MNADAKQTELKRKSLQAYLRCAELDFETTGDRRHAWRAWQVLRKCDLVIPEWVLAVVDRTATAELSKRPSRRQADTDRLRDALLHLDQLVAAHRDRRRIGEVAKSFGRELPLSRRDRPNLEAMARRVAADDRVSKNRLLTAYRKMVQAARSAGRHTTPKS